jgi:hypothetical protein
MKVGHAVAIGTERDKRVRGLLAVRRILEQNETDRIQLLCMILVHNRQESPQQARFCSSVLQLSCRVWFTGLPYC